MLVVEGCALYTYTDKRYGFIGNVEMIELRRAKVVGCSTVQWGCWLAPKLPSYREVPGLSFSICMHTCLYSMYMWNVPPWETYIGHPCMQTTQTYVHMRTCTYHKPHTPCLGVAKTCKQLAWNLLSQHTPCLPGMPQHQCMGGDRHPWEVWLLHCRLRAGGCRAKEGMQHTPDSGTVDWFVVVCSIYMNVCPIHYS